MTSTRKPLIIIPGLGGRTRLYKLIIPIWWLLGYKVHIFSFRWEDETENFSVAIARLINYIDNLRTSQVNIIGVSAGGTAAVNALVLRPQIIKRVVTIATPYMYKSRSNNPKLEVSINRLAQHNLTKLKPRILSLHGLFDQTVPIDISMPKGIRTQKIYAFGHGYIIVIALTLGSTIIRKFMKQSL